MRKCVLLSLAACLLSFWAPAQSYFFPEGERFNPNIQSPEEFLGYPIGEFHTRYDRVHAYFQYLAEASPYARLEIIGYTHERRPQLVLYVSENTEESRLEDIRQRHLLLTRPNQAMPDLSSMPAILNLAFSVHGNEPSTTEAAILSAYWLVAAEGELAQRVRQEALVLIDPAINPDGRDRHSHWANMHRAFPPVADPLDREHNEVWPGGRSNHYWFDLNRDWLPLTQVELQHKMAWYHRWYPNVVGDFHEMGTNSTYFFEPTKPFSSENPVVPRKNYEEVTQRFVPYFAKNLDAIGSLYWTKEVFDNSYPGYGSTYPDIQGGLGLVFEQGSSRGHVQDSQRGPITFAFTIRNQFRTALATLEAGVEAREFMHRYLREFFQTAEQEAASSPTKAYVFGDPADASKNRLFLNLLLAHQIQVIENQSTINQEGQRFEAGKSWLVPTRQPQYRMVRSIFERVTEFADSVFYDASAWNMALAYDMPTAALRQNPGGTPLVEIPSPQLQQPDTRPAVGYLIAWEDYFAPKLLQRLQRAGVYVEASGASFTSETHLGERSFGPGTLLIPMGFQQLPLEQVEALVLREAQSLSQQVYAVSSGLSKQGIDLGSNQVTAIRQPKALMLVGAGVTSTEAGEIWHLLDTKLEMSLTKVDVERFGRVNLHQYNTLILASGDYSAIGEHGLTHLKDWLSRGGVLIAVKSANQWLSRAGITPLKNLEEVPMAAPADEVGFGNRRDYYGAQSIGGSMYATRLDLSHPLAYGYTRENLPVYRNSSIFFAPVADPFQNPVRYREQPLLAGYVSARNLAQIPKAMSVSVSKLGSGTVVHFIDNPNFRGTWFGTNRLFFNALYFGDRM
ncbi:M14 family zinc carboxypeptidase [Nitritalea halalkaliphila]|nr:M14 family zinc carboxypeptidase [Nitritalea halalkaliphila]